MSINISRTAVWSVEVNVSTNHWRVQIVITGYVRYLNSAICITSHSHYLTVLLEVGGTRLPSQLQSAFQLDLFQETLGRFPAVFLMIFLTGSWTCRESVATELGDFNNLRPKHDIFSTYGGFVCVWTETTEKQNNWELNLRNIKLQHKEKGLRVKSFCTYSYSNNGSNYVPTYVNVTPLDMFKTSVQFPVILLVKWL